MWSSTMYVDKSLDASFIKQNVPVFFKKLPLLMIITGAIVIFFFTFHLEILFLF